MWLVSKYYAVNLIKGATLLVLVFNIFLFVDYIRPRKTEHSRIDNKRIMNSYAGRRMSRTNRITKQYYRIYSQSELEIETTSTIYKEMDLYDSLIFHYTPIFRVVTKYEYYDNSGHYWFQGLNMAAKAKILPGIIIALLLNLIVLIPNHASSNRFSLFAFFAGMFSVLIAMLFFR